MPQMTKVQLAGRIARIGSGSVRDMLTKAEVTDSAVAPPSSAALTNEWLTGALCRDVPGAEVANFDLGAIDHGSNARQSLVVSYNRAGEDAGLPRSMFTKSTARFTQRLVGGLTGAAVAEAGFYTHLRPQLGDIEAPTAYYGVADPEYCRSMILMEDIADRVEYFGDPSKHYIDRAKAESMVEVLAGLHGGLWGDPKLNTFDWLRGSLEFQQHLDGTVGFPARTLVGVDRAGERDLAPDAFMRRRADVMPALHRSLAMHATGPQTLLHNDVHLANWYVTKDGRMGLADWGALVRGQWGSDYAYAIMAALTPEDRRAWERELLELYLVKLAEAGATAPSFDAAWLHYRQQTFHGLTFWLYTIGYGRMQPQMQPDEICDVLVHRMTHAVTELKSFEALDETA